MLTPKSMAVLGRTKDVLESMNYELFYCVVIQEKVFTFCGLVDKTKNVHVTDFVTFQKITNFVTMEKFRVSTTPRSIS